MWLHKNFLEAMGLDPGRRFYAVVELECVIFDFDIYVFVHVETLVS